MAKGRTVHPMVQLMGVFQNAAEILSKRTAHYGGNASVALARIGTAEKQYSREIDECVRILVSISIAPEGGRVHIICGVVVDESLDWREAINGGFPGTPNYYDVWKLGEQYPPVSTAEPKKSDLILVNFGQHFPNVAPALEWGKQNGLFPASPRAVFKLGSHTPRLNEQLGLNTMAVASPIECVISNVRVIPGGYWDDSRREARFARTGFGMGAGDWFAFSRGTLEP